MIKVVEWYCTIDLTLRMRTYGIDFTHQLLTADANGSLIRVLLRGNTNKVNKVFTFSMSADQVLSKWLHARTQNFHEAPNNLIWRKFLKNILVNRQVYLKQ